MIIVKHGDVYCLGKNYPYQKMCEPHWLDLANNNLKMYILCATCNWQEVAELETCKGETMSGARCSKRPNNNYGFCTYHQYQDERVQAKKWYERSRNIVAAEMDYAIEQLNHYVYVIAADGFVKIGHSVNPELRLKALKSQSDLTLRPNRINQENMKLLKVVKGGYDLEKMLHHMCVRSRVTGEWYKHDSFVAGIIDRLDDSWAQNADL